jgi:flagellin
MDQLMFSPGAQTLYRLVRTWGALSSLFGLQKPGQNQGPAFDLTALREALETARRNAEEMSRRQGVVDTLKSSVLAGAEALVEKYYGLKADGAPLKVVLDQDLGGAMASVSYLYDRHGRATNEELHLSLAQFTPDSGSNGVNDHIIQNDRIIAHEMTHAIMGRTMDFSSLPTWFAEGTAEYIAGGMERVSLMLQHFTPQQLIRRLDQPWEGDSSQYAAAYLATRYMDQALADRGGLKAVMQQLQAGVGLDQAITSVSGGAFHGVAGFLQAFVDRGEGVAFLRTLDTSGQDPGSIKPGPGPEIVPDRGVKSSQPLRGFQVQWPSPVEGLQLGWLVPPFGFTLASAAVTAYRRQLRM